MGPDSRAVSVKWHGADSPFDYGARAEPEHLMPLSGEIGGASRVQGKPRARWRFARGAPGPRARWKSAQGVSDPRARWRPICGALDP
jgi:hypothetical protein